MNTRVLYSRILALIAVVACCSQPASADQVILDDLIVDGSACIGNDCVNGETFGFDTFRLRENNLRIHFDDTSTAASFPRRDWRIVANESSNGGQEKFSIEDATASRTPFTIEGNASTNSLYVDDGGRIGLGTGTPVVELHVVDGDTPTLRLEQDGSSGFQPQIWDVAGNETNFFVRDATNGSKLPFRIRPNAPGSSIDIAADGDVGIGTSSPSAQFDVNANAEGGAEEVAVFRVSDDSNAEIRVENATTTNGGFIPRITGEASGQRTALSLQGNIDQDVGANPAILLNTSAITSRDLLHITNNNTVAVSVDSDGEITANGVVLTSTRDSKKNIRSLETGEAQDALAQLEPVEFVYKNDSDGERRVGFIAEDVPELVATQSRKTISAVDIVAVLTKVVKHQDQTIKGLNERIEALENQSKRQK